MPVSQSTEYIRKPATAGRSERIGPERETRTVRAPLGGIGSATHAILRIGAGLLFFLHGGPKLFGWFGGMGPEGGTAELFSLMGLAGVLEVFGGMAIVLGFLTRPVAVVLALEMLIAYFYAHAPRGAVPYSNGGELALLYGVVWVYLAGNGAGPASVDRWLRRKKAGAR
jgi:putative oxidoreductase